MASNDVTSSQQGERRRAELYTRIYKFAAEDFAANSDLRNYATDMSIWMQSIETKLTSLFNILSTHTHKIAPHTHNVLPHIHMSTSPGSPTSPAMTAPGMPWPLTVQPNTAIEGLIATQKTSIKWTRGTLPVLKNTTGTIPNYLGNKVITGASVGQAEDISPHLRRQLIIPILSTPSIPPAITGLA